LIYKSKIEKNYLQLFAAFVRACVTAFCSSASPQFLPWIWVRSNNNSVAGKRIKTSGRMAKTT
jgi:hypothetical protein